MFETLESRKMFSVTADAFHETLYVWGDNQNNGISVEKSGSNLVVKKYVDGVGYQQFFSASDAYVKSVRVYGYAGMDTISISDNVTDAVTVYGGKGADWIKGGGGPSDLWGHGNWEGGDPDHGPASDDSANDTIVSGKGYATHHGQKGDDTLITDDTGAASDYDVMYGGPGNDKFYINGGGKTAYAFGEAGGDTFVAKQSATQKSSFYGGADYDKADYSAWTSPLYAKPDGTAWSGLRYGERRQVLQSDVEAIDGTETGDYFSGTNGNNIFFGRGGDDTMYGHGGNDILIGGNGSDTIYGGAGDDTISGDAGNDFLYGDAGNDSMTGGTGSDDMHGGAGNDQLHGQDDGDWLYGDAGVDTIVGGKGSDYLVSHDSLGGNDVIYGDNADGTGGFGYFDVAYTDHGWPLNDFVFGVESQSW